MLIEKMLNDLFGEERDFYKYVDMACEDRAHKEVFLNLAQQERDHYKTIYDVIFAIEPTVPFERAVRDYAQHRYKEMEDKLKEVIQKIK